MYAPHVEIDLERLEARLAEMDRSKSWVAGRLGLRRETFHRYISGKRRFPDSLYPRMVAVLGTTDLLKDSKPTQEVAA